MSSYEELFGAKPLDSFFPAFAKLALVRSALQKHFQKEAAGILKKLSAKLPLEGDELAAHDIIHDLVMNESEAADAIEALGSYEDTFSIVIMKFGSVYWVQAAEFDDVGYFDTIEKAKAFAESNFEPFITALNESKSKGNK
jgi:hypothetical protein